MSYARTAVTRMTLDMSRLDLQRSETVTQGDTNRRWEVTLINGGTPFRLPPNWTAALVGIKPDGTGLLNGCSVVDGKIVYDFAAGAEVATCVGNYPVQFDIWDEVGELVASPKVYVNVLAVVRPLDNLASDNQYSLIQDLIKEINKTGEEVDTMAESVRDNREDITSLKARITTAGAITIQPSEWTDQEPRKALINIGADAFSKGCLVLVAPENDATKEAAGAARMSMAIEDVVDGEGTFMDYVMVARAESGEAPTIPLNFRYVVLKTGTEEKALVAMIGVDAVGSGGGSTGEGVDETAVKKIVRSMLGNVANERQYSENNPPPYPVTSVNGKTGAVTLSASDVKADASGTATVTVATHNTSTAAHNDLRVKLKELSDRLNAVLDSDDTTLDELSEIVAYIKANKTLIDSITTSKVNVTDIIDNLTTNVTNKPLSAAQGAAIKQMIDALEAEFGDTMAEIEALLSEI